VSIMIAKRKKATRFRAKTTHGYGSMKKNRGFGNKGGRGNAGSGKRGDAKKPRYWSKKNYFGKHGFKSIQPKDVVAWNIQQLEEQHQKLLKEGVLKEEKGVFSINLKTIGVQKLLSKGNPKLKWTITVAYASASAVEKIKQNEGSVIIAKSSTPAEPVKEAAHKKEVAEA
jgi:large subunit ribosomal protein L15